jgi:hypothetical protein
VGFPDNTGRRMEVALFVALAFSFRPMFTEQCFRYAAGLTLST